LTLRCHIALGRNTHWRFKLVSRCECIFGSTAVTKAGRAHGKRGLAIGQSNHYSADDANTKQYGCDFECKWILAQQHLSNGLDVTAHAFNHGAGVRADGLERLAGDNCHAEFGEEDDPYNRTHSSL